MSVLFKTLSHAHVSASPASGVGELLADVLVDSLIDSLKMLPFLFLAYLAIEYLEHKKSHTVESLLAKGGRFGFVPGAFLGIIPQCGFSAMAANFYASRVITLGTLLAVFISTSDEAIPIMLAHPESYGKMMLLLGIKLVYALMVGFVFDILLSKVIPDRIKGGYDGHVEEVSCHRDDAHEGVLVAAVKHTINIFATVFLFTFLFGLLVAWLGESQLSAMLALPGPLQPMVAALFGMIPNCASSILLTQLYLNGTISFGSIVAGLSANAGIGMTILFKNNKSKKQNFFILLLVYLLGILPGMILHLAL